MVYTQNQAAFIFESTYKQILNQSLQRPVASSSDCLYILCSYFTKQLPATLLPTNATCLVLFHTIFQPSPLPSWLIIKLLSKYNPLALTYITIFFSYQDSNKR